MTLVDTIMAACPLSSWQSDPARCRMCNQPLSFPRRVWCSAHCSNEYTVNHVWPVARDAARERDHGCVDCRTEPVDRPGLTHVDHDPPCDGHREQGCWHHQDRLFTRCDFHHDARHWAEQRAAKATA